MSFKYNQMKMEVHEEHPRIKRSKWRLVLTLITFVALGLLIYGVRDDIRSVIDNLGKVNVFWLFLIIPIEALNYDVYARFYVSLFKILGKNVRYRDLILHGKDAGIWRQRPESHAVAGHKTALAVHQFPASAYNRDSFIGGARARQ
jgi:hypothetical protein